MITTAFTPKLTFVWDSIPNLFRQMVEYYLDYKTSLHRTSDGCWETEIYADYRDEISDETLVELCKNSNPIDAFYEKVSEWYMETRWSEEYSLKKGIVEFYSEFDFPDGINPDEFEEFVRDFFENPAEEYPVTFLVPYEHYLDQEVLVTILMDTGDGNYDFTLNHHYPAWAGDEGAIPKKASIAWLAATQGYTRGQLRAALNEGDMADPKGFLQSMRVEVANSTTSMNAVSFLVKMTVRQLLNLNLLIHQQDRNGINYDATKNPYCGYLVLDKSTMTGLFDNWNGAGSVFEIDLEKDVKVPIKYIYKALPDCNDGFGYCVGSVYGMCSSAWKPTIKEFRCPAKKTLPDLGLI